MAIKIKFHELKTEDNKINVSFNKGTNFAEYDIPDDIKSFWIPIPNECSDFSDIILESNRGITAKNLFYEITPDEINDDGFKLDPRVKLLKLPENNNIVDNLNNNENLVSIVLSSGITTISSEAFKGCTNVTYVSLPDTVTTIGFNAFEDCSSLAIFKIPDGVETIEKGVFKGCSNLRRIEIPTSVTTINKAFENCGKLTRIDYKGTVDQWKAIKNNSAQDCFEGCSPNLYINFQCM